MVPLSHLNADLLVHARWEAVRNQVKMSQNRFVVGRVTCCLPPRRIEVEQKWFENPLPETGS